MSQQAHNQHLNGAYFHNEAALVQENPKCKTSTDRCCFTANSPWTTYTIENQFRIIVPLRVGTALSKVLKAPKPASLATSDCRLLELRVSSCLYWCGKWLRVYRLRDAELGYWAGYAGQRAD
jgi:hypothetical protein